MYTCNPGIRSASSGLRLLQEAWRIEDGSWHVDISLDNDVPYADAALIVRAIRRGTLINRQPPSPFPGDQGQTPSLPEIVADQVVSIARQGDEYIVLPESRYG